MNCIIVDDEPLARKAIQKLIDQTDNLESIGTFNGAEAATAFLENNDVELVFKQKNNGMTYVISPIHLDYIANFDNVEYKTLIID